VEDPNLQILFWLPLWLVEAIFLVVLVVAAEGGFRIGTAVRLRQEAQAGTLVNTILTAVLGLLALLLAFTYSLVVTRDEDRKRAVITEANALGTAYLRTDFLAEPVRGELRKLLRDYTDTRIFRRNTLDTPEKARERIAESERLLNQIWPTAMRGIEGHPPTVRDQLVITALNDVIDMHTTRLAARRDHLPEVIIFMLFGVSAIGLWLAGYDMGLTARRHLALTATLALLCTSITWVILDLDRPHGGFVQVSQQSLIAARHGMEEPATSGPAAGTMPR
jgi:hypothetical protein